MAERRTPILRPIVAKTLQALKQVEYWLIARAAMAALWILRQLPPD